MVNTGAAANGRRLSVLIPEEDDHLYCTTGGWKSEDGRLSCGFSSSIGRRQAMEDFYAVKVTKIEDQSVCLFGIFDGHGGSRAAEYLTGHLFENLVNHPEFITNTKMAIRETFLKTDRDLMESEKDSARDDGSTASVAILLGNHLYVANVGDSRTIMLRAGQAVPLSDDHKPNRSDERKRIESSGGSIVMAGTWRVEGILAMSRAFGNRLLKEYVIAEPEIQDMEINEEVLLLVLGSDGLWDIVDNEGAVSLASMEENPEAAAIKLADAAYAGGSADNITCIVVKFNHMKLDPECSPDSGEIVMKPDHEDSLDSGYSPTDT